MRLGKPASPAKAVAPSVTPLGGGHSRIGRTRFRSVHVHGGRLVARSFRSVHPSFGNCWYSLRSFSANPLGFLCSVLSVPDKIHDPFIH